jgi:hypothetical protein
MTGEDFTAYRDGKHWGFRSSDGSVAIAPTFDSVGTFAEGLARVRTGSVWGFIDASGSVAIKPRFEQARHFSDGCAKVKENGQWGLIDTAGKWMEDVESQSFIDDRGRFVSEKDHTGWEKPPRQGEDLEGE